MQIRRFEADADLLVVLERGEELPQVLKDVCLEQSLSNVWIDGVGRALHLTLEGGPAGTRRVGGPLEVVQLRGTIERKGKRLESELRIVATREMDTGLEVVGGVMVDGIFEAGSVRIARHVPLRTAKVASPNVGWSAVAAASADLGDPADDAGDEIPAPGDTVEHPKFGPCQVKGIDDAHIRIRKEGGGKILSLSLSHLSFSLLGQTSAGKRIFSIKIERNR